MLMLDGLYKKSYLVEFYIWFLFKFKWMIEKSKDLDNRRKFFVYEW